MIHCNTIVMENGRRECKCYVFMVVNGLVMIHNHT